MGVFNASIMNTEPGGCGSNPWSPPVDWEGDEVEYKALLRKRWGDLMWGQRLRLTVSLASKSSVESCGPYAHAAAEILNAIASAKGIQARITFEKVTQ